MDVAKVVFTRLLNGGPTPGIASRPTKIPYSTVVPPVSFGVHLAVTITFTTIYGLLFFFILVPTMDDFVLSTQKTFLSKCLLVHMFTVGCSQDNALFLLFQ